MALSVPEQEDESPSLQVLGASSLALQISLYRVQPVAAGCIIGWDAAMPLMQCPPYTGAHFADLGRMTG